MAQPPPPDELTTATRVAKAAMVALVVGLFLAITAGMVSILSGGLTVLTTVPLVVGGVLAVLGMSTSVWVGVAFRRRAHQGFAGELAAQFESIEPDIPTARAIMTTWFGPDGLPASFPSKVIASLRVPAGRYQTSLLVNLPNVSLDQRDRRAFEPAIAVAWLATDVPLPTLMVTPELRGVSTIAGADINIENEEFNRRFRIDSSVPGATRSQASGYGARVDSPRGDGPAYGDFARYASAMLHPRAAACLTRLPAGRAFVVTGRLVAVSGMPRPDRNEILRIAGVLAEFEDLIPEHVRRRWGGKSDYLPRER
ncbi:hypothetical protein EK0264_17130 [Epidermidibacterium keratini]|uniref:DUF3137 domain-containing protein n=1 Tax=Epidermidibacterium keratini TaxID=1891644 RepID=A0A7L4YRF7_9ACTN|nr:hypothetical protein [Epidermidibacterium keratini]QHC01831.1 hypothetical protein EK0264_17130 [Epidermidibacterium keratini]